MNIQLITYHETALAVIESDAILLKDEQDAVDLIGNCGYAGSEKIILSAKNLGPDFFELKTRVAGEILQKFSTYRAQLAIVGNFTNIESKSLADFIYESNKTGRIYFVNSKEEAMDLLAKGQPDHKKNHQDAVKQ